MSEGIQAKNRFNA